MTKVLPQFQKFKEKNSKSEENNISEGEGIRDKQVRSPRINF